MERRGFIVTAIRKGGRNELTNERHEIAKFFFQRIARDPSLHRFLKFKYDVDFEAVRRSYFFFPLMDPTVGKFRIVEYRIKKRSN